MIIVSFLGWEVKHFFPENTVYTYHESAEEIFSRNIFEISKHIFLLRIHLIYLAEPSVSTWQ